jgi:hypothetical protein
MGRRSDLETWIRESYGIIHDYEGQIQTSDRPEEKLRAQRAIEQQWNLIRGYLDEYEPLAGDGVPPDIAEIATHFAPRRDGSPLSSSSLDSVQPPQQPAQSSILPVVPNPFGDLGRIADPARFYDREELLRQAFEELSKGVSLSLVGESQMGKSSLLSMLVAFGPTRLGMPREAFVYLNLEMVDDEDDFYAALCDVLGITEPCRGWRLARALRGKRYVLCLDEIEKMTWEGFTVRVRGWLRGLADGPATPLKLVIASRSPLVHLFPDSPELDSPLAGICRQLDVGPFPPGVARAFLVDRLRGTGVAFGEDEMARLLDESGGHPARLQRAAADLYDRVARAGRRAAAASQDAVAVPDAKIGLQELRQKLIDRCDLGDLKDLCFVLGIDDENYPVEKDGFVRELLRDLHKWGRVDEFVAALRRETPWVLG